MYAIRDVEGRFVGQARSKVSAHRQSRSRSHLGSSINRAGDDARIKAREIVRWLQLDGHTASPFEIKRYWGVTDGQAEEIHGLRASAFGPGGKGEVWAIGRVSKILAGSSSPTKWEHVPEHDAWIKEFRFPAVSGWSKTTSHGVAVRRESKGSKDWRLDRTMFGGGWEAVTPTHYGSAAEAKRDADKIFKVFAAARAKGAEIDIDSVVGNDGQIRWHDTHLGLAGVRREDFNMADGSGSANRVRRDPWSPRPGLRMTQAQRKALAAYRFAVQEEDRYFGSVFVNPVGQRRVEEKTRAAYEECKRLGMGPEHGL